MPFNFADITINDLTGRVIKTEQIANGLCGEVWKGTYTIGGRPVIVAVKVMRSTLFLNSQTAEQTMRRLLRETGVWSTCIHPHLAPFIGVCYEVTRGYQVPCLLSPFYKNGTIMQYLKHNSNAVRMDLLRQFISGLAYLHGRAIVHGDLKPTNILIDDAGNAVLADFGHSRILGASGFTTSTITIAGTFRYMAPELMVPENPDITPTPTIASDIWAAGMTGLEILSSKVPYAEFTESQLVAAMVANKLPNKAHYPLVRHGAWSAFEHCWKKNPSERPDVQRLSNYLDEKYGSDSSRSARPTRTRG
ncbi:kinase-like domain-containing protein [Suillus subalutaceus]|uniref:kinase-like domain-containing protein n=1 Tax=Suillus subalutaceus TaxID=48586 RepID=UPI001B86255F|nr:kinase-like domain-containing protein [Suillus subalutaceus]KAG1854146.1 kinase-like domain-containing protein [Suillus subalutaceus]